MAPISRLLQWENFLQLGNLGELLALLLSSLTAFRMLDLYLLRLYNGVYNV